MDKFPLLLPGIADNFLFCAVPLHKSKLKQRGFNQAEEIAKHLSNFLDIPFLSDVLIKTKKTLPQMSLNKDQRLKNVSDCFKINPQKKNQIAKKNILLVDDVFTTGATMEECAKILKENRAQSVWGVVVARD
jgi:ComF family protein